MVPMFRGCRASGVYWDLSLAPYIHMTVDLYMFRICTYHFTGSIILSPQVLKIPSLPKLHIQDMLMTANIA